MSRIILISMILMSLAMPIGVMAQEEEVVVERPLDIAGQILIVPGEYYNVLYLSLKFWMPDSLGFDGGIGAWWGDDYGWKTYPSLIGRVLFRFARVPAIDFYSALGVYAILKYTGGWIPVIRKGDFFVSLGMEFKVSESIFFNAEIGMPLGWERTPVTVGGGFHFYFGCAK